MRGLRIHTGMGRGSSGAAQANSKQLLGYRGGKGTEYSGDTFCIAGDGIPKERAFVSDAYGTVEVDVRYVFDNIENYDYIAAVWTGKELHHKFVFIPRPPPVA